MTKGCAIVANVSTAKIRLTEAIALSTNGFTLTAWIKVTDPSHVTVAPLGFMTMRTATGGVAVVDVVTDAGGYGARELRAESGDGTVTGWTDGPELFPPPTVNTWYGYAMNFKHGDANTCARVYNEAGVQLMEDLGTGNSGVVNLDYVELGMHTAGPWYMGCKVAQGRVWSRMLSEAEVEAELASRLPVSTSSLVSAFEDNPTVDISGNSKPWSIADVIISAGDWPPNYPPSLVPGRRIYVT